MKVLEIITKKVKKSEVPAMDLFKFLRVFVKFYFLKKGLMDIFEKRTLLNGQINDYLKTRFFGENSHLSNQFFQTN